MARHKPTEWMVSLQDGRGPSEYVCGSLLVRRVGFKANLRWHAYDGPQYLGSRKTLEEAQALALDPFNLARRA